MSIPSGNRYTYIHHSLPDISFIPKSSHDPLLINSYEDNRIVDQEVMNINKHEIVDMNKDIIDINSIEPENIKCRCYNHYKMFGCCLFIIVLIIIIMSVISR